MKSLVKVVASTAACALLLSTAAVAAPEFGLGANIGTQGLGAEIATPIYKDSLNLRAGLYGANYSVSNRTSGDVSYSYSLKLFNAGAFADYFPFEGSFRLSAGLVYNGNKFDVSGNATQGSYTLNGHTYTAADVGSINGTVKYQAIAPYLGIGGGNTASSKSGFKFVWDVGVMFTGSPTVDLSANCSGASAASCQADVAAEKQKLSDDVHKVNFWPVLKLGVAYAF
ncbi:hypothetical protein [Aquitalea sp. LB_tupeE]|uniref:hypothetical protein n=1 Tax=Aquitalea sp. LB_tupeE TaxID=2748078 RepID=UPI0015B97A1D|nr:hypothetical protein [Aquitalea sp. LB_tupeE]NWK79682.1 hypothetical protein [Aquitalea sp. LB_tupeE]